MIDMPYHLGCYDTEKGEHDIDVTSPVECLIHCKVISCLLIISLPCISLYIYISILLYLAGKWKKAGTFIWWKSMLLQK